MTKASETELAHPYTECDCYDGQPEPGYGMCEHVAERHAQACYLRKATPTEAGLVMCKECLLGEAAVEGVTAVDSQARLKVYSFHHAKNILRESRPPASVFLTLLLES